MTSSLDEAREYHRLAEANISHQGGAVSGAHLNPLYKANIDSWSRSYRVTGRFGRIHRSMAGFDGVSNRYWPVMTT